MLVMMYTYVSVKYRQVDTTLLHASDRSLHKPFNSTQDNLHTLLDPENSSHIHTIPSLIPMLRQSIHIITP